MISLPVAECARRHAEERAALDAEFRMLIPEAFAVAAYSLPAYTEVTSDPQHLRQRKPATSTPPVKPSTAVTVESEVLRPLISIGASQDKIEAVSEEVKVPVIFWPSCTITATAPTSGTTRSVSPTPRITPTPCIRPLARKNLSAATNPVLFPPSRQRSVHLFPTFSTVPHAFVALAVSEAHLMVQCGQTCKIAERTQACTTISGHSFSGLSVATHFGPFFISFPCRVRAHQFSVFSELEHPSAYSQARSTGLLCPQSDQ
jgi:hypothetical protein